MYLQKKKHMKKKTSAKKLAKLKRVTFKEDADAILEYCHNLIGQTHPNSDLDREYTQEEAFILAQYMVHFNAEIMSQGHSFTQQYMLNKGLKIFGECGAAAASKEMDQLHQRNCFTPISIKDLSPEEKRKAQEALMFLTEKRNKTVKGRMVFNGKPTREWYSREDSASPTVSLESIFLLAVIDAKEHRDVMTADAPNAYIQTPLETKDGEDRVIMKITGVLVDMLVQLNSELYGPHVVFENGKKVVYVQVLRAIYGMLISSLLWFQKIQADLKDVGFEFNPYDPCVANRMINGKQHTVRFYVDDLMSSHEDPKVNDEFLAWLNKKDGSYGKVKATRGKKHVYLGMTFDLLQKTRYASI
jgi:hypothetical protein